jgi:thiol-disulfide isomerase/thioredoxin
MRKLRSALVLATLASLLIGSATAANSAPSFQQAVADYNAGKYSQALGEFKQFVAAYPTNAQSHYYIALCYQSMGNRAEARQEFTLTDRYGDGSLKGYAQSALKVLGAPGTSSARSVASAPVQPVRVGANSAPTQTASTSQVLEFYTDWCHVCKEFEPKWSAAQGKVSGVQFQRYNAEDSSNASLVQKYSVHAYPTLVYLDRSGNVLKNMAGCPRTVEDFVSSIQQPR